MKLYVPAYTNRREVIGIETEKAVLLNTPTCKRVKYNGYMYRFEKVFETEAECWEYWTHRGARKTEPLDLTCYKWKRIFKGYNH